MIDDKNFVISKIKASFKDEYTILNDLREIKKPSYSRTLLDGYLLHNSTHTHKITLMKENQKYKI
jgi:hypothetical protein